MSYPAKSQSLVKQRVSEWPSGPTSQSEKTDDFSTLYIYVSEKGSFFSLSHVEADEVVLRNSNPTCGR
jgi:hypothetical protein